MKGCYNIHDAKRLPRKLKKYLIKSWDRKCYQGIMKGYIILVPWVIQYGNPIVMGYVGDEDVMKNFEKQLKEDYGEEKLKELNAKYAKTKFNEDYYSKINVDEL